MNEFQLILCNNAPLAIANYTFTVNQLQQAAVAVELLLAINIVPKAQNVATATFLRTNCFRLLITKRIFEHATLAKPMKPHKDVCEEVKVNCNLLS